MRGALGCRHDHCLPSTRLGDRVVAAAGEGLGLDDDVLRRSPGSGNDSSFVGTPHRAGAGLVAQRPLRGELVLRGETGGLGGCRLGGVVVTSAPTGPRITLGPLDLSLLAARADRSEEHTSELQSLMRTSYAVFCLKKKQH